MTVRGLTHKMPSQELMDSVDDDGSGELEFPEFKLILTEKLGIGRQSTTNWETKDGKSSRYLGEGAVFGEESVTGTAGPMVGKVMGIEDADIVLITKAMFNHIKDHGFGGDLTRKRELLREHSVVKKCLKRSDLKRIAHSCTLEEIPAKKALCSQARGLAA